MELWIGLVSGLLVAAAAAVGTFVTTKKRLNLEHQLAHDRDLRDLRLPHYQRLYRVSRSLPREWRTGEQPSRADLVRFREEFHNWYFGIGDEASAGGPFLTSPARDVYFKLQNELQTMSQARTRRADPLTEPESRTLRSLASDLRHQIVKDLGTAEKPQVEWTLLGPTPAPPGGTPHMNDGNTADARHAWEDHHSQQRFEHELINRKTTWLLTTQGLLFAAYGVSLDNIAVGAGQRFRDVIPWLGVSLCIVTWIGVIAVILSKRASWRDYRTLFDWQSQSYVPASTSTASKMAGLQWGARTRITVFSLVPDALLPIVFIGAWMYLIVAN